MLQMIRLLDLLLFKNQFPVLLKYCQRIRLMLCCPCNLVPENVECNLGLIPLANQSLQLVNKTLRPRFKGRGYSPYLSVEEVSKNSQICFKSTTFSHSSLGLSLISVLILIFCLMHITNNHTIFTDLHRVAC